VKGTNQFSQIIKSDYHRDLLGVTAKEQAISVSMVIQIMESQSLSPLAVLMAFRSTNF